MNKRNPNFSSAETELLLSLVADNIDVIECRKNDLTTLRQKEECWIYIETVFSLQGANFRNFRELRKKYENIKANARRTSTEDIFAGVPVKKIKLNDKEVVPLDQMTEIKTENDDNYDETNVQNVQNFPPSAPHHTPVVEFYTDESNDKFPEPSDTLPKNSIESLVTHSPFDNKDTGGGGGGASSISSCSKVNTTNKPNWLEEKLMLELEIMRDQHRELMKTKILERQFLQEQQEMARERHRYEMELLRLEVEKRKRELK